MRENQRELNKIVRPTTVAAAQYRRYTKNILENIWKKGKRNQKTKVDHLKMKHFRRTEDKFESKVPETYKGIKVGDNLLVTPEK